MNRLFRKIFSLKFLASTLLTVIFGILLRYCYSHFLDLTISVDNLDYANLSFYTLVSLFKCVLSVIFQEYLPQSLPIYHDKSLSSLSMEEKSSETGGSRSPSSRGRSSPNSSGSDTPRASPRNSPNSTRSNTPIANIRNSPNASASDTPSANQDNSPNTIRSRSRSPKFRGTDMT